MDYSLLDSGNLHRLEQFGPYTLARPCSQALWLPTLKEQAWKRADASFSREEGKGWTLARQLPKQWTLRFCDLQFKVAPTDFGHVGLFPEHSLVWEEMSALIRAQKRRLTLLNLFAYSGGATLTAARAGASVCHVDASKGMVSWARENSALNRLESAPIRWIVDDVLKFLKRESKRGVRYDGIILDPPTFGRGNRGEIFKVERDIHALLQLCRSVLSPQPLFVFLTSHTPGMTPKVLAHLLSQMMHSAGGHISEEELLLPCASGLVLPSGSMAKWVSR